MTEFFLEYFKIALKIKKNMKRHTVVFKLKYSKGSVEEQDFLSAARKLAAIPEVQNFEVLRQTSKKNNFDFGISMEFDSQNQYDFYTSHPDHAQFVQTYWLPYVENFLEIDYELLK